MADNKKIVCSVKFNGGTIREFLNIFIQKKTGSRDALSKTLVVKQIDKNKAVFIANDRISYMYAEVPIIEGMLDRTLFVDVEVLHLLTRLGDFVVMKVNGNGGVFVDVFGGSSVIQSYNLSEDLFKLDIGKEIKKDEIDAENMYKALSCLEPISASDISDLNFVFSFNDTMYAANSFCVCRVDGGFVPSIFRSKDISIIKMILEKSIKDGVELIEYPKCYKLASNNPGFVFSYVFPKVIVNFSATLKGAIRDYTHGFLFDVSPALDMLGVINSIPNKKDVISLVFSDKLTGKYFSNDGSVSNFILGYQLVGEPLNKEIEVSLSALYKHMSFFKGDINLKVGFDKALQFVSDNKRMSMSVVRCAELKNDR